MRPRRGTRAPSRILRETRGAWESSWELGTQVGPAVRTDHSQSDGLAQGEDGCRHEAVYSGTTRETDSHDSCGGQGGTPASQLICLG